MYQNIADCSLWVEAPANRHWHAALANSETFLSSDDCGQISGKKNLKKYGRPMLWNQRKSCSFLKLFRLCSDFIFHHFVDMFYANSRSCDFARSPAGHDHHKNRLDSRRNSPLVLAVCLVRQSNRGQLKLQQSPVNMGKMPGTNVPALQTDVAIL